MLGQVETKRNVTYLNIKDGAIVRHTNNQEETFAYVEGRLAAIRMKDRVFNGQTVSYWYIDLEDGQELYSIGFPYSSNTFKSIVLQLASEDGISAIKAASTIRIEPYKKGGYDKVQVWGEGIKLSWVTTNMPPIGTISFQGRKVKDDTRRMQFICSIVEHIKTFVPTKQ